MQMQRKVNDLQKEFCELHNNFRASCKQTRGSLSWSKYARRMLALLLLQENHLKLKNSAEKLQKKENFTIHTHTKKEINMFRGNPGLERNKKGESGIRCLPKSCFLTKQRLELVFLALETVNLSELRNFTETR